MDDPGASGVALPTPIEHALVTAPGGAAASTASPILRGNVGRALIWLALPVLGEQVLGKETPESTVAKVKKCNCCFMPPGYGAPPTLASRQTPATSRATTLISSSTT